MARLVNIIYTILYLEIIIIETVRVSASLFYVFIPVEVFLSLKLFFGSPCF